MSKARTPSAAWSGIVWKISIFLIILLAVVLYKMNDYFRQDRVSQAQSQVKTQLASLKTSVASQISTIKNVISSYEYDLTESKINWVQLDPFFAIAKAERSRHAGVVGGGAVGQYKVVQYVSRSGSLGAGWSASFLQLMLAQTPTNSADPVAVQIFQVGSSKLISLRFLQREGRALLLIGPADYFQKFFDVARGGKMTSLLVTSDLFLAAHTESDYLGSAVEIEALSPSKFVIEQDDISGTNLRVVNYISRKILARGFAVPWTVVGVIVGFGLLLIGVIVYSVEPIERRIEKYKMQEREQIYKQTLLSINQPSQEAQTPIPTPIPMTATDLVRAKVDENKVDESKVDESKGFNFDELTVTGVMKQPPVQANIRSEAETKIKPSEAEPKVKFNEVEPKVRFNEVEPKVRFNEGHTVSGLRSGATRPGEIFLDLDEPTSIEYMTDQSEHLDLEKALSLDDNDSEELTKTATNYVQEKLTSKVINTEQQMASTEKPQFSLKRKEFKVDQVETVIRRPERS